MGNGQLQVSRITGQYACSALAQCPLLGSDDLSVTSEMITGHPGARSPDPGQSHVKKYPYVTKDQRLLSTSSAAQIEACYFVIVSHKLLCCPPLMVTEVIAVSSHVTKLELAMRLSAKLCFVAIRRRVMKVIPRAGFSRRLLQESYNILIQINCWDKDKTKHELLLTYIFFSLFIPSFLEKKGGKMESRELALLYRQLYPLSIYFILELSLSWL